MKRPSKLTVALAVLLAGMPAGAQVAGQAAAQSIAQQARELTPTAWNLEQRAALSAAQTYLVAHRQELGLLPGDAPIPDEVKITNNRLQDLAYITYRPQMYHGVPNENAVIEMLIGFYPPGSSRPPYVADHWNRWFHGIKVPYQPKVSAAEAAQKVLGPHVVDGGTMTVRKLSSSPQLVVMSPAPPLKPMPASGFHLAWKVGFGDDSQGYDFYVDAENGSIILAIPRQFQYQRLHRWN